MKIQTKRKVIWRFDSGNLNNTLWDNYSASKNVHLKGLFHEV